jgi:hypothetical protein
MKTFKEFLEEARRMRVLRTSHYTSNDAKASIMRGGFKDSPSTGAYHPDDNKRTVYTTPASRVGKDYGHARVSLNLVNPKVTNVNSRKKYKEKVKEIVMKHDGADLQQKAKEASPFHQSKRAIASGSKIVRAPDAHEIGGEKGAKGSYIMVDKDVANKSISKNPRPSIRAKGKPQRTKTQPKKK